MDYSSSSSPYSPRDTLVPKGLACCSHCGQVFMSDNFLTMHLQDTQCGRSNIPHPPSQSRFNRAPPPPMPPQSRNRGTNLHNQVATHYNNNSAWSAPIPPVPPQPVIDIFFSGAVNKNYLTGGCGWWIANGESVVAYGCAPVKQNFSSLLRLEYEGLLNGLQAMIRKGIRRIRINSTSDLILAHLAYGVRVFQHLGSIEYTVKDLHSAILKSLKQFDYFIFELVAPAANANSTRLAEKALADHDAHAEQAIDKKFKFAENSNNIANALYLSSNDAYDYWLDKLEADANMQALIKGSLLGLETYSDFSGPSSTASSARSASASGTGSGADTGRPGSAVSPTSVSSSYFDDLPIAVAKCSGGTEAALHIPDLRLLM